MTSSVGGKLNARAAHSTYFVFGMISLPFLLPVFAVLRRDWGNFSLAPPSDLLAICFFPAAITFVFVWIARFRITVSDLELSYRTLLAGVRTARLSDVVSVETQVGIRAPFSPPFRVVIKTRTPDRPIVINMKVFKKRDVRRLFTLLGDKVVGDVDFSLVSNTKEIR